MGKKYQIIYADPPWSYNDKMKGTGFEKELCNGYMKECPDYELHEPHRKD